MKKRGFEIALILGLIVLSGVGLSYWYFGDNPLSVAIQYLTYEDEDTADTSWVTSLEVGQVYQAFPYFKLLADNRFVYIIDYSDYSEEDLEEARSDAESDEVYPTLWIGEGTYRQEGDQYFFTTDREVELGFETVADVKAKRYLWLKEDQSQPEISLKKGQIEKVNGKLIYSYRQYSLNKDHTLTDTGTVWEKGVVISDYVLPDSLDSFLALYQAKSSEN